MGGNSSKAASLNFDEEVHRIFHKLGKKPTETVTPAELAGGFPKSTRPLTEKLFASFGSRFDLAELDKLLDDIQRERSTVTGRCIQGSNDKIVKSHVEWAMNIVHDDPEGMETFEDGTTFEDLGVIGPFIGDSIADGLQKFSLKHSSMAHPFLRDDSRLLNDTTSLLIWLNTPTASFYALGGLRRLYASWHDGKSFIALNDAIIGYTADSLVVVSTTGGSTFGLCLSGGRWEETGTKFVSAPQSFLFRLEPKFSIMKSSGLNDHHFFYNSKVAVGTRGLGAGGRSDYRRFFISDDLLSGYAMSSCATYGPGILPLEIKTEPKQDFEIANIEVWGFGGAESEKDMLSLRTRQATIREEKRTVDKARFADNEFDREHLLGNTFQKQDR